MWKSIYENLQPNSAHENAPGYQAFPVFDL